MSLAIFLLLDTLHWNFLSLKSGEVHAPINKYPVHILWKLLFYCWEMSQSPHTQYRSSSPNTKTPCCFRPSFEELSPWYLRNGNLIFGESEIQWNGSMAKKTRLGHFSSNDVRSFQPNLFPTFSAAVILTLRLNLLPTKMSYLRQLVPY